MTIPVLSNLENTGKDYVNCSLTCWECAADKCRTAKKMKKLTEMMMMVLQTQIICLSLQRK